MPLRVPKVAGIVGPVKAPIHTPARYLAECLRVGKLTQLFLLLFRGWAS